jgi:hypothetical protein
MVLPVRFVTSAGTSSTVAGWCRFMLKTWRTDMPAKDKNPDIANQRPQGPQ